MDELKKQKIWICWKIENGKKKPIGSRGEPTSADPAAHGFTYVTYDEAVEAQKRMNFNGVGFIIPESFFFLDIDKRSADDPLTRTLLDRFDTYTERSQSGNGFHLYGKCDLSKIPTENGKISSRFYVKNSRLNIELYVGGLTKRFACYTGDRINDKDFEDCTQAVLVTLRHEMLKTPVKKKMVPEIHGDSEELFDMLCDCRKFKNGEKFKKLYDRGEWMGDYPSHSEADQALCNLLAFRIGNDPELINEAFRSSALYREKWDRTDYSGDTIRHAVEAMDGNFYSPSPKVDAPFIVLDRNNHPKISPVLLAEEAKKVYDFILVKNSGKETAQKYVYKDGYYHIYDDNMFKALLKKMIEEACPLMVSSNVINEAFRQLMMETDYVTHEQLDGDENFINFQNGLLHLPSMTLREHSPEIFSTIQIPCDWIGEELPTPVFDQYLDDLFGEDRENRRLLMQFLGIGITNVPGHRMKKALFLIGEGDTGKSQIRKFAELLVGTDHCSGLDLDDMEKRFATSQMYGKRIVGSADLKFLSIPELNVFKKTTGGDSVGAEFKGETTFDFIYKGILWFCGNRLPRFGGDDGAWVYDRIVVLGCHNIIPKEKQDPLLIQKLFREREGVVYKAVMAALDVIHNGYRYSESKGQEAVRYEYRQNNNTVLGFLNECCVREDGNLNKWCSSNDLYQIYRIWCTDVGRKPKSMHEFRNTIAAELKVEVKDLTTHRKSGNFYKHIVPTEETRRRYEREIHDFIPEESAADYGELDDPELPF